MNFTLDQARCFCALTEAGSYQAAAALLNKSHTAIVYAVSCLEEQTGLELLNRSKYRTTLTPEGRRVHQQCRSLLDSAASLEQLCADLHQGWEPHVRLVYDGVLSPHPFLRIFQFFKEEKIPTILAIHSEYLYGVEKLFSELEAELMISILPPKIHGLQSVELKPVINILVARKNHALFGQKKHLWTLNELKAFNFFTVRGAHKSLNLGTQELEEISTFHLSDFSLKKTAIMEGAGFGWLPEYMIQKELKEGTLKVIQWERSSHQALEPRLYFRKKNRLGRASQLILDQISKT